MKKFPVLAIAIPALLLLCFSLTVGVVAVSGPATAASAPRANGHVISDLAAQPAYQAAVAERQAQQFAKGVSDFINIMFSILITVFLIVMGLLLYFLPTIIGSRADKRNAGAIFALNLFAGWCFIGWVIALVWACCKDQPSNHRLLHVAELGQ